MKNEYDVNEMKEILQKYDRVMVKGLLPAGFGNSMTFA